MPKVLYIGFGIAPVMHGGAIVYQESIAERVHDRGWETACFLGGLPSDYSMRSKPYLKTRYKEGIKFIELYNSPNEVGYFGDPERQCRDPYIDILTKRVLDEERPDIVHIHELQMHTASVIDVIYENRIPAIKTMHNYFDICPQRDLMFRGKELCLDYNRGQRCVECLKILPVKSEVPLINKIAWNLLPHKLYKYLSDLQRRDGRHIDDQDMVPQEISPSYSSDQYVYRRKFFIERLNKLDIVHCSSRRSAEIFISHGVLRDKIRVISLSNENIEKISPKPLRNSGYPVVFGYVSGKHLSRGYQVLVDAFSRLDQARAKLIIWGLRAGDRAPLKEGLNIELRTRYGPEDINRAFSEIDVGVVPSIWEEIFGIIGIEWLAARIPVIGSNIGGIPDWLKDGENGFLIPAGDRDALAEKMGLFVNKPELIAELQKKIKRQKTLDEHVYEIASLYKDICAKKKATHR